MDCPVRRTMCPTCPFRPGSKYAYLASSIASSSLHESRVCHSTGSGNAINKKTGLPPYICRGSRDIQLIHMHERGALGEPTDQAWNYLREQIGMAPQSIQDPAQKVAT